MSAGQYFEFLKRLETDPSFCFRYITDEGLDKKHPTYKQCVLTISKSARYSRLFAEKMVKGRFESGEAAISEDAAESYFYAKDIIRGRFELGEAAIATDPNISFDYARNVVKGRFELGEAKMAQCADVSYKYATQVIKGQLPENMHYVMLSRKI